MSIDARLAELNITLPTAPSPIGNYIGGVVTGNLLFMSGVGPRKPEGGAVTGKVGKDLTTEEAYDAARLVALNMLANMKSVIGDLDRVSKIVKVLGMVNAVPDFKEHPKVINGYSDLMVEVFGDKAGKAARSAVGMGSLPNQISVEIEMIVEISD
jgi:enamine deaminase RidA (YjgF/YER057c/UK114 family)